MKQFILFCLAACCAFTSCDIQPSTPTSTSGVAKATVKVVTDPQGRTTEQNNIIARYQMDNQPGSIKHLYVISCMTGDVMMYSTVKGKVTSSGKRLSPVTVSVGGTSSTGDCGFLVDVNGQQKYTGEVLQDDGTYGSSTEYLYWFDSRGAYHQLYPQGGCIVTLSNQPLPVKKISINMEVTDANKQP